MRVEIVADAAITQANENDFFDINSDGTVDVATSGTGDQVQMTEFVSTAKSIYRIV